MCLKDVENEVERQEWMIEKGRDRSKMKKVHPDQIRDSTVSGRNESERLPESMKK